MIADFDIMSDCFFVPWERYNGKIQTSFSLFGSHAETFVGQFYLI